MKKIVILLFLLATCKIAYSQEKTNQKVIKEEKKTMVLRETEDGKDYIVTFENNEVAKIKLNGKEIAKKDFPKHQAIVDKMVKNLPKEFNDAMQVSDDVDKTGGYKPMKIETEQKIKVTKIDDANSKIIFITSDGKEFEFHIKDASQITLNGEVMEEGEIVIKSVEQMLENGETNTNSDNKKNK